MRIPYDISRTALFSPEQMPTIFVRGTDYDEATLCAEASRLGYIRFESTETEKQRLVHSLAPVGFTNLNVCSEAGTQVVVASDPDRQRTLVIFRGTQPDDISDITTDVDFLQCDWGDSGSVHQGFATAYGSIRGWLDEQLHQIVTTQLLITGHSLGAALATLAASIYPAAQLFTFGSPKVGDEAFANTFAARTAGRFVNCADLVTRIPPEPMGYQHVGTEHYIDRFGTLQTTMLAMQKFEDAAIARVQYVAASSWRPGSVAVRDLADHAPINYVSGVIGSRS